MKGVIISFAIFLAAWWQLANVKNNNVIMALAGGYKST